MVDYKFNGHSFSKIPTRTFEKFDMRNSIKYNVFTDIEKDKCINYYLNDLKYSIGTNIKHCKVTYQYSTSNNDECLCCSNYVGISKGTHKNGCCNDGYSGYFSRFVFVYIVIIIYIISFIIMLKEVFNIKWFITDYCTRYLIIRRAKKHNNYNDNILRNTIKVTPQNNTVIEISLLNTDNVMDTFKVFRVDTCVVCKEQKSTFIFKDSCWHICVCKKCYDKLSLPKKCPLCSQQIKYITII